MYGVLTKKNQCLLLLHGNARFSAELKTLCFDDFFLNLKLQCEFITYASTIIKDFEKKLPKHHRLNQSIRCPKDLRLYAGLL
jgi:hypothetical protein